MKKKLSLIFVIFAVVFCLAASATFFPDIIVTSPDGIWTDTRAYTNLSTALTAIGANERDVYIVREETVTTLVIPANVRLHFLKSGAIANSNTLTINTRNIHADHQIFTGAGAVNFTSGSEVRTRWFEDFETAIIQTSNDIVTLTVDTVDTLLNSAAVGDNVLLKWNASNLITIAAGQTLSNIGDISAPDIRLFVVSGSVAFKTPSPLVAVRACWFGTSLTTLGIADSAAAAAEKQLIITPGSWVIDDNVTFTSTVVKVLQNADLQIATTKTLTFAGSLDAGPYQIFSCAGTGKVVLTEEVYPEWWGAVGDGITDDTATIAAAMSSGASVVDLASRTYLVATGSLNLVDGQIIEGQGSTNTVIKNKSATGFVFGRQAGFATLLSGCIIRNLTIDMDSKGDVGIMWESIGSSNVTEGKNAGRIDDVRVINVPSGTFTYDDGAGVLTYSKCGIAIKGSAIGGSFRNVLSQVQVYGTSALAPGQVGILLTGNTNRANATTMINCYTRYLDKGIHVENANDCLLLGCEGTSSNYGLYCESSGMKTFNFYSESCTIAPIYLSSASRECSVLEPGSYASAGSARFTITGATGTFTVGETVTGATSTETAIVLTQYSIAGKDFLIVYGVSGTFTANETINGATISATYINTTTQYCVNLGLYNSWEGTGISGKRLYQRDGILDGVIGFSTLPASFATPTFFDHPGNGTGKLLTFRTNNLADSLVSRFSLGTHADSVALTLSDGTFIGRTVGTLVATDGAVTLPGNDVVSVTATGAVTVTSITATGNTGRIVTLVFADGNVTITDGGNLKLAGNLVGTVDDTMTLVCNGTNWYEISRSVN